MRQRRGKGTPQEWRRYWAELRLNDRDVVPDRLGPPNAFANARADAAERAEHGLDIPVSETGRHSRRVRNRLRLSCAGWRTEPTAAEFYDAVHKPQGSGREGAITVGRSAMMLASHEQGGPRPWTLIENARRPRTIWD